MPFDDRTLASPQELQSIPQRFELDRRDFLKLCGGGLLVCLAASPLRALQREGGSHRHELPEQISAWLYIAQGGQITVYTGKVEIGQNIRTSLAQAVAEELRVPFDSISMVMGDTDLTPWDMGTFGSRTTPTMAPVLRKMTAAARQLLVETAARQWNADPDTLKASDERVTNPATGKSLTYGEITRGKKLTRTVTGDVALTPATDWKIDGTSVSKVGGRDFVTGAHRFPSDIVRPGMLHGKVLRPTGFNATLVSVNTTNAAKMPGVQVVRDGDFIGVAAPDLWTAEQAIHAIDAKWSVPPQISNAELFEYIHTHPDPDEQPERDTKGSVDAALAHADVKLQRGYTVQYIAHAPLEPRAAVAEWNNGKLTVWTGTQRPFAVRDELVQAFQLPFTQARVIQPDMGSAYGGKHTGECAVEAARLAKGAGKPVKLVWTREEEFIWAYFRPAGLFQIRSGARRDGTLVAWEHVTWNAGSSGIETPYNVPNWMTDSRATKHPLRQGAYRGIAATANNFARECHMDEMAHALKMDPLQFRLKNLANPRLQTVYRAAAEKFGWSKSKPGKGTGIGIAGGLVKGGHVATCVEVEADAAKNVRIRRAVQAWECGAIVNPDGLRNQIEGALIQAMGGALFEAIEFNDGRILNASFAKYRVPRFRDIPQIEIILIDRKDLPSAGAGEIGIIGLAPAVSNAIFSATGQRARNLPMTPQSIAAESRT